MQTAGSVVSVWGWTPSRREIVKNPIQGLEGRRGGRGSRPSLVLILLECNQFGQFLALVALGPSASPLSPLRLPKVNVLGPFYLGCR